MRTVIKVKKGNFLKIEGCGYEIKIENAQGVKNTRCLMHRQIRPPPRINCFKFLKDCKSFLFIIFFGQIVGVQL